MATILLFMIASIILFALVLFTIVIVRCIKSYNHIKTLRVEASAGNDQSQYLLGYMYFTDTILPYNMEQAEYWLSNSSDNGNKEAQFLLAMLYMTKALYQYDDGLYNGDVIRLLTTSAESGYVLAQVALAEMYAEGCIATKNIELSKKWYKYAAMSGDTYSQKALGNLHTMDMGDKYIAYAWYQVASFAGDTYAQEISHQLYNSFDIDEKEKATKVSHDYVTKYGKPSTLHVQ